MRTTLRTIGLGMLLATGILPALAESNETLEKFRASFESRMNAELDEQGQDARKLRQSYLEALNRLKSELGRTENLKAAAQVVTEIEAVEDGEEAKALPEDADHRLKRMRKTWEDGLEGLLRERNEKVSTTANLYLKALDDEKRKLTRAGQIKEALLFEEEEKRIKALPEVAAAMRPADKHGNIVEGDVALASRGAKVSGASDGGRMIDGDSVGDPSRNHEDKYAHARWPCEIVVELGDLYMIEKIRFRLYDRDSRIYRFRVAISPDKNHWTSVDDKSETGGSGWQNLTFDARPVRYIRVEGIHNSRNERFHIIELEAYCAKQ